MNKPKINKIKKFEFPGYEKIILNNGIVLNLLRAAGPDIIKMDIVINAGRYYEKHKAIAKTTIKLIKEGTSSMSSKQLAEKIDYYGATMTTGTNMDTSEIHVYCLAKHFDKILPLLKDIFTDATFPESEIEKYKKRNIEKLKIELSKNEVLSYRYFTEYLYGRKHPYGYNTEIQDYNNINKSQLLEHYNKFYGAENITIFAAGNIDDHKIRLLDQYLGSINKNSQTPISPKHIEKSEKTGKFIHKGEGKYQTAIKIGRDLFTRSHPDYPAMYLLNTILGGYFGSRLNANLRENKGYTYGIYSSLDMMKHEGYFMIGTEVGTEYTAATIEEIYKEINILQNKLISEDELSLVKNYIKGSFLSLINGHINTLKLIKTIETAGLNNNFFSNFINNIDNSTAVQLMQTANKYLNPDNMTEVQVLPVDNKL